MSITLHLAPEQEAWLEETARKQGQETENYALTLLLRDFRRASVMESEGESLSVALDGLIGTLNSSEYLGEVSHDAENSGQMFTEIAAAKHKANQL